MVDESSPLDANRSTVTVSSRVGTKKLGSDVIGQGQCTSVVQGVFFDGGSARSVACIQNVIFNSPLILVEGQLINAADGV